MNDMVHDSPILTEEEAIHYLRLDTGTTKFPKQTLKYYREKGLLRGVRIGRYVRYPIWELVAFVKRVIERNEE